MHLVGPWLTTSSTKRRKAKGITQRDRDALVEHRKYLRSLGIDPDRKIPKYNVYDTPRQSQFAEKRTTHSTTQEKILPQPRRLTGHTSKRNWRDEQERLEISRQYTIAPAYNKGPYMVVSGSDIKTAGKKV